MLAAPGPGRVAEMPRAPLGRCAGAQTKEKQALGTWWEETSLKLETAREP